MKIQIVETNRQREQAERIRMTVFVKEQNVPVELELDEYDQEAIHFIGYQDGQPIAASRLRFMNQYGKLERICVLKTHRGKSYGQQLIQQMEKEIKKHGYTHAVLHAQTQAIDFYKRIGYIVTSDEFVDAGIPHVTMEKILS
ncbi:MAG TPA: GNAT family N-acetyltransferase [Bacillota bacterium]|nr:GNAT family N-acetyltransferase [Bacillota bacterium]